MKKLFRFYVVPPGPKGGRGQRVRRLELKKRRGLSVHRPDNAAGQCSGHRDICSREQWLGHGVFAVGTSRAAGNPDPHARTRRDRPTRAPARYGVEGQGCTIHVSFISARR